MVMFGAQLDNERVEEWAPGYVDYGHLKKVLSELVRSGKSQARLLVDSEACRASTAHVADGPRLEAAGGVPWRWKQPPESQLAEPRLASQH